MVKITEKLAKIEDPSQRGNVKHKLIDILTIIMCAVLYGIDELSEIMGYVNKKRIFGKKLWNNKNPTKTHI